MLFTWLMTCCGTIQRNAVNLTLIRDFKLFTYTQISNIKLQVEWISFGYYSHANEQIDKQAHLSRPTL